MSDFSLDAVWIVVPAYNEEKSIGDVVSGLNSTGHRVLVVDDGSTDNTQRVATAAGASVVRHLINLGQGAALQTGIDCALNCGADYLVTLMRTVSTRWRTSNGCWPLCGSNIPTLFLGAVSWARWREFPFGRRVLLWAAILFTRLTTGLKVSGLP